MMAPSSPRVSSTTRRNESAERLGNLMVSILIGLIVARRVQARRPSAAPNRLASNAKEGERIGQSFHGRRVRSQWPCRRGVLAILFPSSTLEELATTVIGVGRLRDRPCTNVPTPSAEMRNGGVFRSVGKSAREFTAAHDVGDVPSFQSYGLVGVVLSIPAPSPMGSFPEVRGFEVMRLVGGEPTIVESTSSIPNPRGARNQQVLNAPREHQQTSGSAFVRKDVGERLVASQSH